jgi:CRP-like cAMP-binding protein
MGFEPEPPPPPRGALPHIPLFSALSNDELIAVMREAMEVRTFAAGEVILREGEPGEAMYALAQGTVSVLRQNRVVASMEDGAFFGEMALLSGSARLATVTAQTDVVVLEFPRASMDALIERYPNVKSGLEGFFRERLLANLLRSNPLLAPLTDVERAKLSASFQSCSFKPKEIILEEGREGQAVYLLLRGRCRVFHRAHTGAAPYPDLIEGDAFGEISVATEHPVTAVVQAQELVVTLRVPAADFRAIVLANPEVKSQILKLVDQRLGRTAQLALADSDLRI